MHQENKDQVLQLREQSTRQSKKQARQKLRSSFKVHLKQLYGHSQMAKFFLKYPPAALDSLLQAWQDHMTSNEYLRQRTRSDPRNEAADVVRQQRELKLRCHGMRAERRHAVKLVSALDAGKWLPWDMYDLVQRFRNGALDTELDQLTRQHGYGKLHATDRYLSAPTLFDHAARPLEGR